MDKKNGFLLYTDHRALFELLEPAQCKALILAVFDHESGMEVSGLDPVVAMALAALRLSLDRNRERHAAVTEARRKAGSSGGQRRAAANAPVAAVAKHPEQTEANAAFACVAKQTEQSEATEAIASDNENENENENDIPENPPLLTEGPPRGSAPTPEKPRSFKRWTLAEFEAEVARANADGLLTPEQVADFIGHWTQPMASGRALFTAEKAWDTRRRMQTALRVVFAHGANNHRPAVLPVPQRRLFS